MADALNMHKAGRTGGWSASGTLRTGNDLDEVHLQCDFPVAADYTVEFNLISIPDTPDPLVAIRCEALITWSVEGNSVTRRVTVGNGVSVTGVGAACKVSMIDVTDRLVPLPAVLGKAYTVFVQVAPGTRGNTQEPPTLTPFPKASNAIITVPALGLVFVPIPPDAGVVAVSITASPDSTSNVVFHQQGAALLLKAYNPQNYIWVPVASGATIIGLSNGNAGFPVNFSVTFGIDG